MRVRLWLWLRLRLRLRLRPRLRMLMVTPRPRRTIAWRITAAETIRTDTVFSSSSARKSAALCSCSGPLVQG